MKLDKYRNRYYAILIDQSEDECALILKTISNDLYNKYSYNVDPKHYAKIYYTAIDAARKVINDTFFKYRNSKIYKLEGDNSIDLYIYKEGTHKNGQWVYTYMKPAVEDSNIINAYEDDIFIETYKHILLVNFGAMLNRINGKEKEILKNMVSSCVYNFATETIRWRSIMKEFIYGSNFGFIFYYKNSIQDKPKCLKFLAANDIEAISKEEIK